MSYHPLTRLPVTRSSATSGTTLSLTSNVTGVTAHTDPANSTLYVLGDCALNGTCHAKTLKSTLPAHFQSDERMKKNFKLIENPFYALNRITGYSFDYKEGDISSLGFKAQDIENIFPFLVQDTDGTKYVSYSPLIAVNWEATKELHKRQMTMCQRIQQLEMENSHIRRLIQLIPRLNSKIHNLERKVASLATQGEKRAKVDHTQPSGRNDRRHRQDPQRRPPLNMTYVREFLRRVCERRV